MIFSTSHKVIIFSPPKTGTRVRLALYDKICDQLMMHTDYSTCIKYADNKNHNLSEYNKYCFVRNPWHRCISFFHMFNKKYDIDTHKNIFKQWIMNMYNDAQPMHVYYSDESFNVMVDKIMQLENLTQEIDYINKTINYTPTRKCTHRTRYDVNVYKEWFDQEMIDFVAEKEWKTIELTGYTF